MECQWQPLNWTMEFHHNIYIWCIIIFMENYQSCPNLWGPLRVYQGGLRGWDKSIEGFEGFARNSLIFLTSLVIPPFTLIIVLNCLISSFLKAYGFWIKSTLNHAILDTILGIGGGAVLFITLAVAIIILAIKRRYIEIFRLRPNFYMCRRPGYLVNIVQEIRGNCGN